MTTLTQLSHKKIWADDVIIIISYGGSKCPKRTHFRMATTQPQQHQSTWLVRQNVTQGLNRKTFFWFFDCGHRGHWRAKSILAIFKLKIVGFINPETLFWACLGTKFLLIEWKSIPDFIIKMQKNRQNIQGVAYKSRPKFNLKMANINFALQCPLWPQ